MWCHDPRVPAAVAVDFRGCSAVLADHCVKFNRTMLSFPYFSLYPILWGRSRGMAAAMEAGLLRPAATTGDASVRGLLPGGRLRSGAGFLKGEGSLRHRIASSPVRIARRQNVGTRIVMNNKAAGYGGEGGEVLDDRRSRRPIPPNAVAAPTPAIKKVRSEESSQYLESYKTKTRGLKSRQPWGVWSQRPLLAT